MTQKKKAELQRKLSVAPVAKPPDDLAERIKADIPRDLFNADRERRQFSRSVALNLRVAASILLLIGGAFVMVLFLSPTGLEKEPVASATIAPVAPAASPVQLADQAKESDALVPPARREGPPAAEPELEKKDGRLEGRGSLGYTGAKVQATAAVSEGARRPPAAEDERSAPAEPFMPLATAPPAVAAAPPVPPPAPAVEARPDAAARKAPASVSAIQQSQAVAMREAVSESIAPFDRSKLFGISVDRQAFDRLKTSIEAGAHPDPAGVDVEALVNYFAGPPPRTRDVHLDVEVTSAPANSGVCCVLRVTVDTPPGDSSTFVGRDAVLEIDFDPRAVRDFSRTGGEDSTTLLQPLLPASSSVTALYDFQLKPNPPSREPIATVTLRYRTLPRERERTIVEKVRLGDITRSWSNGSPRHRLASLGALWAQTLRDSARAAEVARKAEELSKQQPEDARARELANAAGRLQQKTQEQR